jgi:GR25 family glycosyltransferase involved in LPS biosynthesis
MSIDKVYYINLDRRTDRHLAMIDLIKTTNMTNIAERVGAVDGSKLDISTKNNDLKIFSPYAIDCVNGKRQIYGITLTKGGIGCALSHRNVWKNILYTPNVRKALIMEDDVTIKDKKLFKQQLDNIINNAPKDYDVLFIGYHPASIKYINTNNKNAKYVKSAKTYGLFGYVVTKKGAKKLLNIDKYDYQIDTEISRHAKAGKVNIYLVRPDDRIIYSEPSEISSAGTDIQLNKIESFVSNPATYNTIDSVFHIIIGICLAGLIVLCIRTIVEPSTVDP